MGLSLSNLCPGAIASTPPAAGPGVKSAVTEPTCSCARQDSADLKPHAGTACLHVCPGRKPQEQPGAVLSRRVGSQSSDGQRCKPGDPGHLVGARTLCFSSLNTLFLNGAFPGPRTSWPALARGHRRPVSPCRRAGRWCPRSPGASPESGPCCEPDASPSVLTPPTSCRRPLRWDSGGQGGAVRCSSRHPDCNQNTWHAYGPSCEPDVCPSSHELRANRLASKPLAETASSPVPQPPDLRALPSGQPLTGGQNYLRANTPLWRIKTVSGPRGVIR